MQGEGHPAKPTAALHRGRTLCPCQFRHNSAPWSVSQEGGLAWARITSLGRPGAQGARTERFPPSQVKSGSRTLHSQALVPPLRPTDCLRPSSYPPGNRGRRDPPDSEQIQGRSEMKSQLPSDAGSGSSHLVLSNLFTKEKSQRSCISSNLVSNLESLRGFPGETEGTWEAGGGALLVQARRCQGNVTRGNAFAQSERGGKGAIFKASSN